MPYNYIRELLVEASYVGRWAIVNIERSINEIKPDEVLYAKKTRTLNCREVKPLQQLPAINSSASTEIKQRIPFGSPDLRESSLLSSLAAPLAAPAPPLPPTGLLDRLIPAPLPGATTAGDTAPIPAPEVVHHGCIAAPTDGSAAPCLLGSTRFVPPGRDSMMLPGAHPRSLAGRVVKVRAALFLCHASHGKVNTEMNSGSTSQNDDRE
jgi:hypothetical protein